MKFFAENTYTIFKNIIIVTNKLFSGAINNIWTNTWNYTCKLCFYTKMQKYYLRVFVFTKSYKFSKMFGDKVQAMYYKTTCATDT